MIFSNPTRTYIVFIHLKGRFKMQSLKYVIGFCLLLITSEISGQQKSLPKNPSSFPEAMYEMMEYKITEKDDKMLEDFTTLWKKTGAFSQSNKKDILKLSRKFLDNRARAYPHFKNLIRTLMLFKEEKIHPGELDNWIKSLNLLLKQGKRMSTINNYMTNVIQLLKKNILFKTYSTQWKLSQDNYSLAADSTIRFIVHSTNLTCYAKSDSIKLYNTAGELKPLTGQWTGTGGKVYWDRAGYNKDKVYAELNDYTINMKKYKYKADSVIYHNNEFFNQPIRGKLHDKVMNTSIQQNLIYPQFISYTKSFKIEDLYKNVNYKGGFKFEGNKIIGTGTEQEKASLSITRADSNIFTASSNYFVIRQDKLKALQSEIAIYIGYDSIYHTSLDFSYLPEKRLIRLMKSDNISSGVPYFNSYHNLNMNFEVLRWEIDKPYIYMTRRKGASKGEAIFKSLNYFNKKDYQSMRHMDPVHPLVAVKKYSEQKESKSFNTVGFAKYMGFSVSQTRHYLMRLASKGFIFYDPEKDEVKVKKRLYDYIKAHAGKIDYDVMNFQSETRAPTENAILNLRTMDLTINGMPEVPISNAQNVDIIPKNQEITMKRNRSFSFHGKIKAGKFTFYGNNFFFDYDSFKINLQNIDSLAIRVQTGVDKLDRPVLQQVRSVIEDITGELYVDERTNKSGLKDYPTYPIFESDEYSYVYYDDPNILNGVYPKEEFYFKLDPFTIDSLDNFTKDALNFSGSFKSGDIFPEMREELKLMEDRSLGLESKTAKEGKPIYDQKGTFFKQFKLNHSGLHGAGKIKYLTSTIYSDDFVFYPDSVNTEANKFVVDKDAPTDYPKVNATTTKIHWEPYNDNLIAENLKKEFKLYNGKCILDGSLSVQPSGLSGKGNLDMQTALMKSQNFSFQTDNFDADTADFSLRSLKNDNFTLTTQNVNAHIDYNKQKGTLKSNAPYSLVRFPENQFYSYLDHFVWHMGKKEFDLGLQQEYPNEQMKSFKGDIQQGPRYISVHPDQDSLNFVSSEATYDYKDNILQGSEVQYLDIADAKIYPADNNVTVKEDARIKTLKNAEILASDSTRYHRFDSATVNVKSRNRYKAEGDYKYVDRTGAKQTIHFNTIGVDTAYHTYAHTQIPKVQQFKLSPKFLYQGEVLLKAEEQRLTFDGATKILSDCKSHSHGNDWLSFNSKINPDNIFIPVPEDPENINNRGIYSGIIMAQDSIHVYSSFLSGRKNYSDTYISNANGYIHYNQPEDQFEIARKKKLYSPSLPGNYVYLDEDTCKIYGEGHLNLGLDLWQVNTHVVGNAVHQFDTSTVDLNAMVGINFFMHKDVIQKMTHHLDSLSRILDIKRYSSKYMRRLDQMLYQNGYEDLRAEDIYQDTLMQYPEKLKFTILFDNLNMAWDQQTESYYTKGKIGIVSIKNTPLNISVDGYMEFRRRRNGDRWDLYLKINRNNWYYFGYNRGIMQTWSSYQPYNEAITQYNVRKRTNNPNSFWNTIKGWFSGEDEKQTVKNMERPKKRNKIYRYMRSTASKMNGFLQRYRDRTGETLR